MGIPDSTPDSKILDVLDDAADSRQAVKRFKYRDTSTAEPLRFQVVHQVQCWYSGGESGLYLDTPWIIEHGPRNAHLRCMNKISNLELYLERNKGVIFLVYRQYECCGESRSPRINSHNAPHDEMDPSAFMVSECVSNESSELISTLGDFGKTALDGITHPDFDDIDDTIYYPYVWWYHRRGAIDFAISSLDVLSIQNIEVFRTYLQTRPKDTWNTVDDLLSRGCTTAEYLKYIYVSFVKRQTLLLN
jgi:hypothetical protein